MLKTLQTFGTLILISCAAAAPAHASLSLEFGRNTQGNASVAYISGHDEATIASQSWSAALPSGFSTDESGIYVPTRLLGCLRDGASSSSHADAAAAVSWMRSLMGTYADTTVSSIPSTSISTVPAASGWAKWCGQTPGADMKCPLTCTPTDTTLVCSGCGCQGVMTFD